MILEILILLIGLHSNASSLRVGVRFSLMKTCYMLMNLMMVSCFIFGTGREAFSSSSSNSPSFSAPLRPAGLGGPRDGRGQYQVALYFNLRFSQNPSLSW